jgi:hypothetical protein
MEFSGTNSWASDTSESNQIDAEKIGRVIGTTWIRICIGIGAGILFIISLLVHDTEIGSRTIFLEFLMFGFLNALPPLVLDKNRDNPDALLDSLKAFFLYGGLYIILQLGGFFTTLLS